jgi:hypothetical protein
MDARMAAVQSHAHGLPGHQRDVARAREGGGGGGDGRGGLPAEPALTHGVESVGGDDSVVSSLRVSLRDTQRVVVGGAHLDAMAVEVLA